MKWLVPVFVAVAAVAGVMLYVRFSPNDPARWNVDPVLAGRPGLTNGYLIRPEGGDAAAPVYAMSAAELSSALARIAGDWPRTRLFAGSVESGRMTFITRSRLMGFPDFTSITVLPAANGATFAAFARARFGRSDVGVNRARLKAWIRALGAS